MVWTSQVLLSLAGVLFPSVSPWCSVPKAVLLAGSTLKWWKTEVSASVDDQFEYQAQIAVSSGGVASASCGLEIEYTYEFKSFVTSTLTPATRGVNKPSLPSVPEVQKVRDRIPRWAVDLPNGSEDEKEDWSAISDQDDLTLTDEQAAGLLRRLTARYSKASPTIRRLDPG